MTSFARGIMQTGLLKCTVSKGTQPLTHRWSLACGTIASSLQGSPSVEKLGSRGAVAKNSQALCSQVRTWPHPNPACSWAMRPSPHAWSDYTTFTLTWLGHAHSPCTAGSRLGCPMCQFRPTSQIQPLDRPRTTHLAYRAKRLSTTNKGHVKSKSVVFTLCSMKPWSFMIGHQGFHYEIEVMAKQAGRWCTTTAWPGRLATCQSLG